MERENRNPNKADWPSGLCLMNKKKRCLKIMQDGKIFYAPAYQYDNDLAMCSMNLCLMAEDCHAGKLKDTPIPKPKPRFVQQDLFPLKPEKEPEKESKKPIKRLNRPARKAGLFV